MTPVFPIDILSPPAFPFPPSHLASSLQREFSQSSLSSCSSDWWVGLWAGKEEGLGQTEASHSCPLPQASSLALAWLSPTALTHTLAKG
jgi:hypothetical protein